MKTFLPALLAFSTLAAPVALASERAPNSEELTAIESALQKQGFTSWTNIGLDSSGTWDVDYAKHSDGKVYDVALKTGTYEVVNKVLEE